MHTSHERNNDMKRAERQKESEGETWHHDVVWPVRANLLRLYLAVCDAARWERCQGHGLSYSRLLAGPRTSNVISFCIFSLCTRDQPLASSSGSIHRETVPVAVSDWLNEGVGGVYDFSQRQFFLRYWEGVHFWKQLWLTRRYLQIFSFILDSGWKIKVPVKQPNDMIKRHLSYICSTNGLRRSEWSNRCFVPDYVIWIWTEDEWCCCFDNMAEACIF